MKTVRNLLAILAVIVIATQVSFAAQGFAPEVNPEMGLAALALLGGAIAVIRGRAKR
jgi:uncharacterized membrane-anchored protein